MASLAHRSWCAGRACGHVIAAAAPKRKGGACAANANPPEYRTRPESQADRPIPLTAKPTSETTSWSLAHRPQRSRGHSARRVGRKGVTDAPQRHRPTVQARRRHTVSRRLGNPREPVQAARGRKLLRRGESEGSPAARSAVPRHGGARQLRRREALLLPVQPGARRLAGQGTQDHPGHPRGRRGGRPDAPRDGPREIRPGDRSRVQDRPLGVRALLATEQEPRRHSRDLRPGGGPSAAGPEGSGGQIPAPAAVQDPLFGGVEHGSKSRPVAPRFRG